MGYYYAIGLLVSVDQFCNSVGWSSNKFGSVV